MKKLIARIRNTDRRKAAIVAVVVAVFYPLNWGLAHLTGWVIDGNPGYHSVSEAAQSGYFMGFIASFAVIDAMRRADKALTARFGRKTAKAAE